MKLCIAGLLSLFIVGMSAPVRAQSAAPEFQLTQASTWLRASPNLLAGNTVPIFNAERYRIIERTSDNEWLRLEVAKADGQGTWVLRSFGTVVGELNGVPAIAPQGGADSGYGAVSMPPWIPAMSARMRQVYDAGIRNGRDARMFTVIGDCNSEPTAYLGRIAAGLYQLPPQHAYLQGMIGQFNRSFSRISLAARGGYGTAAMFDPSWSDPFFCEVKAGEGPFPCEVRFSNASIAFIELGTGDQFAWQTFEKNYRPLIEHALARGVVPVLVTKADDLEASAGASSGYINGIIRRLAATYDVPLLDFAASVKNLENGGLIDEGNADFHLNPQGSDMHLLVTLQTLHSLTRGNAGVAAPSAPAPSVPAAPPVTAPSAAAPQPAQAVRAASGNFVVTAPAINVRNGPGLGASVIDAAYAGASYEVQAVSADGAWVQIGSGRWVFAALGSLGNGAATPAASPQPAAPTSSTPSTGNWTVTAVGANIRNAPGLSGTIVGAAWKGAQFSVLERSSDGEWVRVGDDRWIFASLGE